MRCKVKKLLIVLVAVTLFVTTGYSRDYKTPRNDPGVRVYNTAQTFSLYFDEIPGIPFVSIQKLPKFNDQHSKHTLMANLPFRLKLDFDADGITDVRLSPFVKLDEVVTEGAAVDMKYSGYVEPEAMRMCEFDRFEFRFNCCKGEENPCMHYNRKFRFNRVIFRRTEDGNVTVTLRDGIFNSGLDEVYETNFIW